MKEYILKVLEDYTFIVTPEEGDNFKVIEEEDFSIIIDRILNHLESRIKN